MRKVKIITDSCSDLSPEILKKYDIDYARMSTIRNGNSFPALLEWGVDEVKAFYNAMRNGERITTSQATAEEFYRIFPIYLDSGYDIVYVACSSKQSGSVNTAQMVASKLLSKRNDGAEIYCIDSLNASLGEGILAIEAAKLASQGKSAAEIYKVVTAIRNNVNEYCTVHTLDYLKRAGRVTASSAFFGNLMGVKPIIISDAIGVQTAYKKVKGRNNSLSEIVSLLTANAKDTETQVIYIAHSDCSDEEVEFIKNEVKNNIPCADIYVGYIGPIIGASIGPDAFAVFAFGSEVTLNKI